MNIYGKKVFCSVHVIRVLLIYFFSFNASAIDCKDLLDKKFLSFLSPQTLKADLALIDHLRQQSKMLDSDQRKLFFKIIEEMQAEKEGIVQGMLLSFFGKYQLMIHSMALKHNYGRVTLVHELDHLIRKINGGAQQKVAKYFDLNYVIKDEREAFNAEYEFLRKAYSQGDLQELKNNQSHLTDEERQEAINLGFINANGQISIKTINQFTGNKDELVEKLWMTKYDEAFIKRVEQVLSGSEQDYIKEQLYGQSTYQLQSQIHGYLMALIHGSAAAALMKLLLAFM